MFISDKLVAVLGDNSWIRKMYDRSCALQREKPYEKIYDLSLGNPVFEPPPIVVATMVKLLQSGKKGLHRYLPNQGLVMAREWVAAFINQRSRAASITSDLVMMSGGAGGAINIVLNTLLNPGDEVLIFQPYFVEYTHYIHNFAGVVRFVPTTPTFRPDLAAIEVALNPRSKVLLINSPNNPTGVVYSAEELQGLAELLLRAGRRFGHEIALVSDEPYTRIAYDGVAVPSVFDFYPHSFIASSFSKDLALAGERFGYIAVSPHCADAQRTMEALVSSQRVLGFVNAPSLLQHVLPELGDAMVAIEPYQQNRDTLYQQLLSSGYRCVKPQGAFYLFPEAPGGDDLAFIEAALRHNLVLVPGRTFGCPGHVRISFCFEPAYIEATLGIFSRLAHEFGIG